MEADRIFPENWKEVVRGKKVILYNTGVGSMLSGGEKHIEKMKWVFSVFREHPEVVLWWRPHPLELATVKSMRPELMQQYVEMRTLYQEKNVGILDESADLHRAIAISDAYYGSWSSAFYFPIGFPYLRASMYLFNRGDRLFILSKQEKCRVVFDRIDEKFNLSNDDSPNVDGYSTYYAQTDDYIYAVSKKKNRLMKIRKSDMAKQEITIKGSVKYDYFRNFSTVS